MSKIKITKVVEEMLYDFLQQEDLMLWKVEFVKEVKDWFLRIYIDNKELDKSVSLEDCEKVSRYLSEILDEKDLIEQKYYLEVSSPGIERELFVTEHFEMYLGKDIEVKLYEPIFNKKKIIGSIENVDDETLDLKVEDEVLNIKREKIAKAKVIVFF